MSDWCDDDVPESATWKVLNNRLHETLRKVAMEGLTPQLSRHIMGYYELFAIAVALADYKLADDCWKPILERQLFHPSVRVTK